MKEAGIIFSAPMVRAIQDGRKTMTRRIVKPQPDKRVVAAEPVLGGPTWEYFNRPNRNGKHNGGMYLGSVKCPYGTVGDFLWVREKWRFEDFETCDGHCSAAVGFSDGKSHISERLRGGPEVFDERMGWRSPIHMPRWASRITLEITLVRVERLQDIREEDAIVEGVFPHIAPGQELKKFNGNHAALALAALAEFRNLWSKINGKSHPWESNPWVWVIGFKRVEGGAK